MAGAESFSSEPHMKMASPMSRARMKGVTRVRTIHLREEALILVFSTAQARMRRGRPLSSCRGRRKQESRRQPEFRVKPGMTS